MVKITHLVYNGFFESFDFFHIFNVISTIKIPKKLIFPKSSKITEINRLGLLFAKIEIFLVEKTFRRV